MEKKIYSVNNKWLLASIVGSIWASFEIILGSFLHNIRFPMSGTILTIIAGVLMILFAYQWQERGVILRAGIIAALMKSISPSAVLIGPMTAIFFEALIFEVVVFFLGHNWISYTVASIGLLYSVLIHKILTWLILYGWNLVRITKNMYDFIIKQLNIENVSFTKAFLLLSLIYMVLGIFTAFFGIIVSKKAMKTSTKNSEISKLSSTKKPYKEYKENEDEHFSVIFLILIFVYIVVGFIITNSNNLIVSSVVTIALVLFGFLRYRNKLRRFMKPGIWIQAFLLLIISVFFYNGLNKSSMFDKQGLEVGMNMIYRMIILLFGFTAISAELRNPLIKALLFRRGLRNLYLSLELSFSILPAITKYNLNFKTIIKNPVSVFGKITSTAEELYEKMNFYELRRKVIIITGDKEAGKTNFAKQLTEILFKKKVKISGFLSLGVFENNERTKFELADIETNEKIELANKYIKTNLKFGKFYFNKEAISFGEEIINKNIDKSDFFMIDEVGMLEVQNQGWYNIIEKLFNTPNKIQIWTVRQKYVDTLIKSYGIVDVCLIDIQTDTPELVADRIFNC